MRHLPKLTIASILALCVSKVFAQNEDCNAILTGDLMNKVITSRTETSSEREVFRKHLFSLSESEAFKAYEKDYERAVDQSQSGGLDVNYVYVITGKGDFATTYKNKLTEKEFKEEFNKGKKLYQSDVNRMKSSDNALASSYASYIRDPNTIEAWKACVTRDETPALYAFGSRDESGTPFINVVWAPGKYADSNLPIEVTFVPPSGTKIVTGRTGGQNIQIASGTGASFLIEAPNPKAGFMVQVNGERRHGGELRNSFTAKAEIPPLPSGDCSKGLDTCISGYVWREARPGDTVCVKPEVRDHAITDNVAMIYKLQEEIVISAATHLGVVQEIKTNSDGCLPGWVARAAFEGDNYCVKPETRAQAAEDNRQAKARRACHQ